VHAPPLKAAPVDAPKAAPSPSARGGAVQVDPGSTALGGSARRGCQCDKALFKFENLLLVVTALLHGACPPAERAAASNRRALLIQGGRVAPCRPRPRRGLITLVHPRGAGRKPGASSYYTNTRGNVSLSLSLYRHASTFALKSRAAVAQRAACRRATVARSYLRARSALPALSARAPAAGPQYTRLLLLLAQREHFSWCPSGGVQRQRRLRQVV